jgi:hypothetical protein
LTSVPLRLGSLVAGDLVVRRSTIRWIVAEGQNCQARQVIAYCSITLAAPPGHRPKAVPLRDEVRDFQVAFAAPVAGRVRRAAGAAHRGGLQIHQHTWEAETPFGWIDADASANTSSDLDVPLLFVAGRRMSEVDEGSGTLLAGWHSRTRAWWGDHAEGGGTVVALGLCDINLLIRGEQNTFFELFEEAAGPAQAVCFSNEVVVPCAAMVAEQLTRTQADRDAIAADLSLSLSASALNPTPADWMFAGCLLAGLNASPLGETYDVLSRSGLTIGDARADAILMSLNSEAPAVRRHRRLGYTLHIANHRIADAGPAIRAWLLQSFELIRRTPDDIKRDLARLITLQSQQRPAAFVFTNLMSTSGLEDIINYSSFDKPLNESLAMVRAKDMNLMLDDLVREHDADVLDVDALAAEFGGAEHLPDGIHASGSMLAASRAELLRILARRGFRGFTPRAAIIPS